MLAELGTGIGLVALGIAILTVPRSTPLIGGLPAWVGSTIGALGLVLCVLSIGTFAVELRHTRRGWFRRAALRVWERSPIDITWRNAEPAVAPAPRGFLDFEEDWTRAIGDINAILPKIGTEVAKMGPRLTKHAADLTAAKDAVVGVRIRRAKESARTFKRHAKSLERSERRLREDVRTMSENYMALLENETTRPNASNPEVLNTMKAGSIAAGAGIEGYRQTVIGIRKMAVEQNVNQTSDRLANVLGALKADIDGVVKFCDDGLAAIRRYAAPPSNVTSRRTRRRRGR